MMMNMILQTEDSSSFSLITALMVILHNIFISFFVPLLLKSSITK